MDGGPAIEDSILAFPPDDSIRPSQDRNGAAGILLVSVVVFVGLAAMGFPLPVLSKHIHDTLGFDLVTVGWVMGLQSAATLLSRPWAGRITDRHGGKRAVLIGLAAMGASGVAYGCSTLPFLGRDEALSLLIAGRLLTGIGEGLVITGGGAWAVGLAGMEKAGHAMSWIGLSMFGGLAAGAAIGAMLDFRSMSGLVVLAALAATGFAAKIAAVRVVAAGSRLSLRAIVARIWRSGLVLALSAVGFSAVSAFVVLGFEAKGWQGGEAAIAIFGIGHVAARLLLGTMADRARGPVPAMMTMSIEAIGLALVWLAPIPAVAFVGAALAGFGFSMVYPLMALPALRAVPESSRGMAIGLYDAFFDVAMGVSALICGIVANMIGISAVFIFATGATLAAIMLVITVYSGSGKPVAKIGCET